MIVNASGSDPSCGQAVSTKERGFALLVVLWIIASAALLVAAFAATMRGGATFVAAEVQSSQIEALLDAGAEIAATRLIDEVEERRWPPDGRRHTVSFAGSQLTIAIEDPNGLIDLNKTDEQLLLPFFQQFTGSDSKAAQLCDLIKGARGGVAAKAGQPPDDPLTDLRAKPVAFVDVAQLRGLKGMSLDLYRKVAPFVTVYNHTGRINPLAAPREVLSIIPNLTGVDIERAREGLRRNRKDDAIMAEIMDRAGSYLSDEVGPAYTVSVEVDLPGGRHRAGKVYVLAVGLDADAPYRVIAKKPITFSN